MPSLVRRKKFIANSEFTREKLERQYTPKPRTIKPLFFKQSPMNRAHTEVVQREQQQICQRAVQSIKCGRTIALDWRTKSNFRTTKTAILKSAVQRQNTQLTEKRIWLKQIISQKRWQYQKKIQMFRKLKFDKMRKMLNLEIEVQKQISENVPIQKLNRFLDKLDRVSESYHSVDKIKVSSKSFEDLLDSLDGNSRKKIQTIQKQIVKRSNLSILKKELQRKFTQIRQVFNPQEDKIV